MAESPNSQVPKDIDKDLTCILKLFVQEADTNQMKTADHKHTDSTLFETRRLMMLETSPWCQPIWQLCTSWSCTLQLRPPLFWWLPWKPSHSRFGVWAAHSTSLASCNKCCTFLQHHPVSVDWLYCGRTSGPKLCLLTRSKDALLCFFLLFLLFPFELFLLFFFWLCIFLKSEATYRTHTSSGRLLCSFLFLDTPWASERDHHTLFCIHWNLPTTLDALNQEFIHFCKPCHHLTTIWSFPHSSYSVFP